MGPYAREDQAAAEPMPQAVAKLCDRDERIAAKLAALTDACDGMALGDFDRRILQWLAQWPDTTVQVIADLIARGPRRCTEPGS